MRLGGPEVGSDAYEDVEERPDGAEDPAGRILGGFVEPRIPIAHAASGSAAAHAVTLALLRSADKVLISARFGPCLAKLAVLPHVFS